ncbi:MAG: hypothetical protein KGY41_08815, partial [Desulfovermiculus sp.]|nr:hypothetical protein [Desulfovermiculus sp.]
AMRKAGMFISFPSSQMNYESVLFKENLHTILTLLARLARLIILRMKMRVQKALLHSPEVRDQKSEVSKNRELLIQFLSKTNVNRLFAVPSMKQIPALPVITA